MIYDSCNFQYLFIIQYFYAQTMYDILVQVNKRCANDDLRCSCFQKGTLAVYNGTLNTYSILLCLGNYFLYSYIMVIGYSYDIMANSCCLLHILYSAGTYFILVFIHTKLYFVYRCVGWYNEWYFVHRYEINSFKGRTSCWTW